MNVFNFAGKRFDFEDNHEFFVGSIHEKPVEFLDLVPVQARGFDPFLKVVLF